jgi:hypothetical protein
MLFVASRSDVILGRRDSKWRNPWSRESNRIYAILSKNFEFEGMAWFFTSFSIKHVYIRVTYRESFALTRGRRPLLHNFSGDIPEYFPRGGRKALSVMSPDDEGRG